MLGQIGRKGLVQPDEQCSRNAARDSRGRDGNPPQHDRSAPKEDELGQVCVALWLHRGIVSSLRMSRTRTPSGRTIRAATYNILLGGESRRELVRKVLRRLDADVVALQEVSDVDHIRTLARELKMQMLLGEPSDPDSRMHTAILTRLPVRSWHNRRHHGRMLRSHLHCEIETGGGGSRSSVSIACTSPPASASATKVRRVASAKSARS